VPSVYWKLGGNHRGAASIAFLEDFQEIMSGGGVERLQSPIVEDQKVGAAEVAQKTGMATVAAGQRQFLTAEARAVED
jgi:hypothetical protein